MDQESIKITAKIQHFYEYMNTIYSELSLEYVSHHSNGEITPEIRILNEICHIIEEFEETFEDHIYLG